MRTHLLLFGCAWVGFLACAHAPKASEAEKVKKVAEKFHEKVRWKDFGAAAEIVVPERRKAFEDARRSLRDDRDLTVSEYDLEELKLDADAARATVVSRIQWMRLPSVSANDDVVSSEFVNRQGQWLLLSQDRGPFSKELPAPGPPAQP